MQETYTISPEVQRLLRAAIPNAQERLAFEDGLRAIATVVSEQNFGWLANRASHFLERVITGEQELSVGLTLPSREGSDTVLTAVANYLHSDPRCRAYWHRISEHPVRSHACLFALFAVLRLALPTDEDGLLPFIRQYLSQIQLEMIQVKARNSGRGTVFFALEPHHPKHFDTVPDLMEADGIEVFRLFAYLDEDALKRHNNAYFFEHIEILSQLEDVAAFVMPASYERVPHNALHILLDKVSVCEFEPEMTWLMLQNASKGLQRTGSQEQARELYSPREQLFPMYDMVIVPSRSQMLEHELLGRFYGYSPVVNGRRSDPTLEPSPDGSRLLNLLMGKRINRDIRLVPAGSQMLLSLRRKIGRIRTIPEMIAFSPIGMRQPSNEGAWYPQMAIYEQCAEILELLLKSFPDRSVVFCPHKLMSKGFVEKVLRACERYDNLQVHDPEDEDARIFARTAVMVTDFSANAFLFAGATGRPVVFYSRREELVQTVCQRLGSLNYLSHRAALGDIAQSPETLVELVKERLETPHIRSESIAQTMAEEVYHQQDSSEEIARSISALVRRESLPEWTVLRSTY